MINTSNMLLWWSVLMMWYQALVCPGLMEGGMLTVQGSWVKQKQLSARCRAGQDRSLRFQDYSLMTPVLPMHSGVTRKTVNAHTKGTRSSSYWSWSLRTIHIIIKQLYENPDVDLNCLDPYEQDPWGAATRQGTLRCKIESVCFTVGDSGYWDYKSLQYTGGVDYWQTILVRLKQAWDVLDNTHITCLN